MLLDMSRKTRKTHIQKTHTRTHTQTQKFLGRHMAQRYELRGKVQTKTRAILNTFVCRLIKIL
jgi:hypothetical protein